MKTLLYYFTGTGNTLVLARELAELLGRDTELIRIQRNMTFDKPLTNCRVGIVYPVYAWGIPIIIRDFVSDLKVEQGTYIFALANCNGMPGLSMPILQKAMHKANKKLAAGFLINMPGNFVAEYNVCPQDKQNILFAQASKQLKIIASHVLTGTKLAPEKGSGLLGNILSIFLNPLISWRIPVADKFFRTDKNCNLCGTCAKVCPVKNVKIVNNKVKWHRHCEMCLACMHWCPKAAIQLGPKSARHSRYHHPDIKLADILNNKGETK